MRTLLAVDGNSLAHRAFHAYGPRSDGDPGMTNSAGRPVYATYGFLSLLSGICERIQPSALVVGFDDHTSSVRKERCPEYKAQRESKGRVLYDQLDDMRELLGELGVNVVVPSGLEADDVVGSAARAAEEANWRCVIATSDRDSFALITEKTTVLRLVSGLDNAVRLTPRALQDQYGILPGQYLDYAALRGDSSDNLVGVKGIGEKTAAKLLQELGSVQAAFDDTDKVAEVVGKACAKKLLADGARDAYERNVDIMTILRDIEIDVEASVLDKDLQDVADVLHRWELPNLVRKVGRALQAETSAPTRKAPEPVTVPVAQRAVTQAPPLPAEWPATLF